MAPMIPYDDNPTVVAIDKDKNSTSAVGWAIDHLAITNPTLILIHVKIRNQKYHSGEDDIFTHFRTFCARKGITVQEVVEEGTSIHGAILDYVNRHHITNLVLGAPTKPLARKVWSSDVPTLVNKSIPDFCAVYVISKGKTQSIRPAGRHAVNSIAPPRVSSPEPEESNRRLSLAMDRSVGYDMMKPRNEMISRGSSNLSSFNSLAADVMVPKCLDITQVHIPDFTNFVDVDQDDNKMVSVNEVKRLKLEVKQTMDMYNTACKAALNAKMQADELHRLKIDEVSRLEQARFAEEAALQIAEMEKAKCRAAIEAAEKAQRIAEREAQRRMYVEQKAKREADEKNRALNVLSNNDIRYRKYTIEEIEAATNKFDRLMKIGEGGYGPVYKGKLDHTAVAIKVLRPNATQGRQQFQQEVEVLSCMRHPNMVLLMGACPEYGCLVYEFMNNGSLEDRLFRKGNTPPIPYHIRFKLSADIATALLFLHQAKPEPLVHRDLKPANILLDRHYTCKISDVGLARLVPPNVADSVTQYHMTSAAGTFCYIDPEYQQTGKLGTKSDIYSLGVMLLQVITARPPMGLTHHVERAIQNGTFHDLLDPTVMDWPVEEALDFAKLALRCASLSRKERPDLGGEILPELNRLKLLGMNGI